MSRQPTRAELLDAIREYLEADYHDGARIAWLAGVLKRTGESHNFAATLKTIEQGPSWVHS